MKNILFVCIISSLVLASAASAFFVGFGSANAVEAGIKKGQETRKIPAVLAPCDMRIEVVSANQINISWNDKSDDERGFEVERKQEGGFFMVITAVDANRTFYVDSGLAPDAVYCYRVRAYNSAGFSEYSPEACAKTLAISGTPAATSTSAMTAFPSRTPSGTVTLTPTVAIATPVGTASATRTVVMTSTPSKSPTVTTMPTSTPTKTGTETVTVTATATITMTGTATITITETATATPDESPTLTDTMAPTQTTTDSPTPTDTVTATATSTP